MTDKGIAAVCWRALGVVLLAGMFAGCDTDSANGAIHIEPSSATLREGQSQEFTATGGYAYRWRLEDSSRGMLNTVVGNRVTYTSRFTPTTGTWSQILHVESYIEEVTSSASNQNALGTAEAYIWHE